MPRIYAGTSGWAYSSWKPKFYPGKLRASEFLNYYASRLNSVEVNYTFRNFPTKRLLREWLAATPENFIFAIKAHYAITHVKRLRGAFRTTSKFLNSLRPLRDAGRLGPVLFQLPPFSKCDVPLLENFLARLPDGARSAFEFRHASWFNEEVYSALRKANAALCLAESEKIETPQVETADFSYLRLRKDRYSPQARGSIAARVVDLSSRGDVFVFFRHEAAPHGALYAERLLAGTITPSSLTMNQPVSSTET